MLPALRLWLFALSALAPVAPTVSASPAPIPVAILCTTGSAAEASETQDPKLVLRALETWLRTYLKGRYDIAAAEDIARDSLASKLGILPPRVGKLTYLDELEILVGQAAEIGEPEHVEAILEVAAVGLGDDRFKAEHQPHQVRRVGEVGLGKVESNKGKAHVLQLANGETQPASRKRADEIRTAAVRALGRFGDPTFRPLLETQLQAESAMVRLAAAEALTRMAPAESLEALGTALAKEADGFVIGALAAACSAILEPMAADPTKIPRAGLDAVHAAIAALGRGNWRSDMALLTMLEKFRNRETVPALIKVLERFKNHPDDVRSGKLSGLLLHRAHELLVSLTGALYPMDEPQQWLDFWARERESFRLADKPTPPAGDSGTVAKGFFGIPVQGTRVTFIMDISGSMEAPMAPRERTTTGAAPPATERRIDAAKRELLKAVESLPEIASFNLVVFADQVRTWQSELVPATSKGKARFRKYVEGLRPLGGTNLHGGMVEGLKMKSLVWTDRYETHVDEIFLLSDGAPSVGTVIDPAEILVLVHETNRFAQVRINTVFITSGGTPGGALAGPPGGPGRPGPRGPMDPASFMEKMAEQNGGKFVLVR